MTDYDTGDFIDDLIFCLICLLVVIAVSVVTLRQWPRINSWESPGITHIEEHQRFHLPEEPISRERASSR